jgi:protein-S-isoprenylcysteine O-methyltransferase Ste14
MMNILRKQNGMSIVGQGGKIILFTLPPLIAAILVHTYLPQIAALPESISFIKPLGYLLLLLGLILWGAAVIQLMTGFSKGKLVTTGAYGVVRNPIYSSATFFILPAVALMTLTWVYFVASVFLYVGVMIFIGKEEKQLTKVFGKEYEDYIARVDRLVPLRKPSRTGPQELKMVRKLLLICGILSSLLYVATDVMASWGYEGYSYTDQTYSELLATGAPTRSLMLLASIAYNLLVAAFAVGVWTSARPKRAACITGAIMIGYAALSMVTPLFFQMDMREAEVTPRGSLHGPMTAVMSLFILLSMGFGAFLLGRRFRWYSFATIVVVLMFGALTGLQIPQLVAGQPTPLMGLTERINIYATMLWFAVLAIVLLRAQGTVAQDNLGGRPLEAQLPQPG